MDELSYHYTPNTNRLNHVTDAVVAPTPADYNDLKTQSVNNYSYDEVGDLVSDVTEGISDIKWFTVGGRSYRYGFNGKENDIQVREIFMIMIFRLNGKN